MILNFAKMHGLGNDFMVVDLIAQPAELEAERVRAWSDRQRGVGFDQLLAVEPPTRPDADFRFTVFNADGGRAEQCGNGARCFAAFVLDRKLTKKRCLALETGAGLIRTEMLEGGDVRVAMATPKLDPVEVPFLPEHAQQEPGDGIERDVLNGCDHALRVGASTIRVTPVSMGNPHAVLFVDDVEDADVHGIGEALQDHGAFPERVNVSFLQVVDRGRARLRVYERGVGETLACGSGACAAMVAARLHDRVDAEATLSLPGGDLLMRWPSPDAPVEMTGPTTLVYRGEIREEDDEEEQA